MSSALEQEQENHRHFCQLQEELINNQESYTSSQPANTPFLTTVRFKIFANGPRAAGFFFFQGS
jgi:hypothetical protein